ncbi:MAG TPA: hypothetical protein VK694_08005 [Verrucomicrobiae bacterium]|nr:hypothetical protein [Verrucomicrobiae bacterium]
MNALSQLATLYADPAPGCYYTWHTDPATGVIADVDKLVCDTAPSGNTSALLVAAGVAVATFLLLMAIIFYRKQKRTPRKTPKKHKR